MEKELTAIVHFFSLEGLFRLKSEERQRERFDSLAESYGEEGFETPMSDELFAALMDYQADQREKRKARERARLEKKAALPVAAGAETSQGHIKQFPAGRYVLLAAQNNTFVDKAFLAAIRLFCLDKGARLLVGRLTYNKSGFAQPDVNGSDDTLWYDPAISPDIVEGQISLDNFAHFVADANIIPTAKNPLSGFDGITPAGVHVVLPASKIALKVSAALKGAKTKIVTSTGAVTLRNYILRKAGAVAAIEHNIGAVYVDTREGELRHIEQVEGFAGFYDGRNYYSPDSVHYQVNNAVAAIQFGDIHAEKLEAQNLYRAINMIEEYGPENVILHDILDFSSRNHHNIKDCVFLHVQQVKGNTVANDLAILANTLDAFAGTGVNIHVIESNHDLAINTWLKNADFKTDPINATTYLQCMLALYKHNEVKAGQPFNMLRYAYEQIGNGVYGDTINFHETDDSVIIAGVEMGCHGHNGVNGSRGSPVQFRALGIPMNTGHTHSPSIHGRVYTAGVLGSLDMGYNLGASSWAYADIVTYTNGQRQIIFA